MTFKSEPPTKPGAYWHKWNVTDIFPRLLMVSVALNVFSGREDWGKVESIKGFWSSRLQPEDEIEKAWIEGVTVGMSRPTETRKEWALSRAKQVVEGEV